MIPSTEVVAAATPFPDLRALLRDAGSWTARPSREEGEGEMAERGAGEFQNGRILLVDDDAPNLRLLERFLRDEGYTNLRSTTRSGDVARLMREDSYDLVILDLQMPFPDGFALLEHIREVTPGTEYLPVLVLTGDARDEVRKHALRLGAKDFLTKPLDFLEARYRIRNLLQTRWLHRMLQAQNDSLEARVRERTRELDEAKQEVLSRLAEAAEHRDGTTGEHTRRVGELAGRLASALGLAGEEVELIRRAAPLHDVGKISVPDAILLKPGTLEPDEISVMQAHTTAGAKILAGGQSPLIRRAEEIALSHHERWDGSGYPRGLAGSEIPISARIVAVVDVYDALTSDRPYRGAWSRDRALDEIARGVGSHFDPLVARAFLALMSRPG